VLNVSKTTVHLPQTPGSGDYIETIIYPPFPGTLNQDYSLFGLSSKMVLERNDLRIQLINLFSL